MSSIPAKDWKSVWELLTSGIRDYVRKNGFTDVVLGLSGGMDSALVAALAVDALGKDHVHGVMMPSPWSSEGSIPRHWPPIWGWKRSRFRFRR